MCIRVALLVAQAASDNCSVKDVDMHHQGSLAFVLAWSY